MRLFCCWYESNIFILLVVLSLCGEWWYGGGYVEGTRLLLQQQSHAKPHHQRHQVTSNKLFLVSKTTTNAIRGSHNPLLHGIRGGWTEEELSLANTVNENDYTMKTEEQSSSEPISVLVSTSFGSTFLDKKKKFQVSRSFTIHELKMQIEQKFPGLPPSALQRLFFGSRLLFDHETISDVMGESTLPVLPLLLDMVSGTASYNKTMSVSQAIEGYVSTVVHLTFLSDKMRTNLPLHPAESTIDSLPHSLSSNQPEDGKVLNEVVMDTIYYRQLFDLVNSTIYERYAEDIAAALEAERNPEVINDETRPWRGDNQKKPSPLSVALAKEFDLNMKGVKNFVYYSLILVVFATLGTATEGLDYFVISMIPLLWMSKLRQFRLLSKILLNAILIVVPKFDILMPLFPVTLQVIAKESSHWCDDDGLNTADENSGEDVDEDIDEEDEYDDLEAESEHSDEAEAKAKESFDDRAEPESESDQFDGQEENDEPNQQQNDDQEDGLDELDDDEEIADGEDEETVKL